MTDRELERESGKERTPEEIQAEISRTRSAIQDDIKAISERFTPEHIKESAKGVLSDIKEEGANMVREAKETAVDSLRSARDNAAEAVSDTIHELGDRARHAGAVTADYARHAGSVSGEFLANNAIPLSLIGLGVGWLAMSMRRQSQLRYLDEDDYLEFDEDTSREFGDEDTLPGARPRRARMARARGRTERPVHGAQERGEALAHRARERAGNVADNVAEGARARGNQLAEGARERANQLAEGARELAHSARERVGSLATSASESVDVARARMSEMSTQVGEQVSAWGHEARERARRAQERTRHFAEENPLAVGALAIATGVGLGLLLPATRPENRLMGKARDRLLGDARELIDEARATGDHVSQKVRETAEGLRGSVSEARVSH